MQNYTLVLRTDFEIIFLDIKQLSIENVFAPMSPYTELRGVRARTIHTRGSRTMIHALWIAPYGRILLIQATLNHQI